VIIVLSRILEPGVTPWWRSFSSETFLLSEVEVMPELLDRSCYVGILCFCDPHTCTDSDKPRVKPLPLLGRLIFEICIRSPRRHGPLWSETQVFAFLEKFYNTFAFSSLFPRDHGAKISRGPFPSPEKSKSVVIPPRSADFVTPSPFHPRGSSHFRNNLMGYAFTPFAIIRTE